MARTRRFHTEGYIAWKIFDGRGAMPGWKAVLTENQIRE